jgi:ribosomal protein L3 glutamine methyltransferase
MMPTATDPPHTLRDALRLAVSHFAHSGIFFGHGQADAYDEAAFLVTRALALPAERIDVFLDAALLPQERETLLRLIDERVRTRTPAAYLLGEAWLQGFRFYVDKRCIIPRSFIGELLRDAMQPWIAEPQAVTRVLDLCTGSGCLAIIAAHAFDEAAVDAADVSEDALAVAARNIADYGLQDRVRPVHSDLFDALEGERYDLILCNPPYVTDDSMERLPPEYRHEPRLALAGGADGMDLVRHIVGLASRHLAPGGMLVVEVGDGRAFVEQAFPDLNLTWLTTSAGDDMVFLVPAEELP